MLIRWKTGSRICDCVFIAALLTTLTASSCSGGGGSENIAETPDTTPPSVPVGLTATAVSTSQIDLSWTASTDSGGGTVTNYRVFRNGNSIPLVTVGNVTAYQDTGLTPSTPYSYTVLAIDSSGNPSGQSLAASATTLAPSGALVLSLVPSRFSGVAPLAVFFDASGTTSPLTSKPIHNVEYRWDFGDRDGNGNLNKSPPVTGTTTWATGSRGGDSLNLRNVATGPVAAHVYETPGTYTVTLTAFDGTNTDTTTVTITVDDPDSLYSGDNTICFSTSGTFTDVPPGFCTLPGVTQITAWDWLTVRSYLAIGRRLLLRRGEVWAAGSTGSIDINGPWTIGAFGSGAKPRIQATANDIFILPQASSGGPYSDMRVMDLVLDGNGLPGVYGERMIDGGVFFNRFTVLRVDIQNVQEGFFMWDQSEVVIADSTITSIGYTIFSERLTNSAVLGSTLLETELTDQGDSNFRVEGHSGLLVSNNTFVSHQAGRPQVKLNASSGPSVRAILSDNEFIGAIPPGGSQKIHLGPQNDSSNESISDFIVERNWFLGRGKTFEYLILNARKGTVRNNIFNMSIGNPDASNVGILIERRGIEPVPDDIQVYNNTFYSSFIDVSTNNFVAVRINSPSTNMIVKNNLASAPNYTNQSILVDNGTGTVKSNNTLTNNPGFVSGMPSIPADFKPAAGSVAIGSGALVPVWSDFFRVTAPANRDLGAVSY